MHSANSCSVIDAAGGVVGGGGVGVGVGVGGGDKGIIFGAFKS